MKDPPQNLLCLTIYMFRYIITLTSCFMMVKFYTFFFFFGKMGKKGEDNLFLLNNMVIGMGCSFVSSLNELCSLINSWPLVISPLVFLLFFFQSISNHEEKNNKQPLFHKHLSILATNESHKKNASTPKFNQCKAHKNSQAPQNLSIAKVHKNTFSQKFSRPPNFIY